ncbi:MAG: ATP-binding cassette domain-containing protein [Nitrospirota bacterium]|jgi:phospholipid/cholesterol/gamma-HCH transport system ATP-binding protein
MSEKSPLIEVRDVSFGFGEEAVLRDVRFSVAEGEIFAILGASGSGKSTLMKLMVGLLKPDEGHVLIHGEALCCAPSERQRELKRGIGVLFQSGALFGSMTVGENVALPLEEYTNLSPASIREAVRMKLAMVGLARYENHLPSELSGGMQKRAGLARAMALDPAVLFFDEPSAGLDPLLSAEIDDMIRSINAMGTTIVIVTHELLSILAVAERVVMLDEEERGIIAEGDPRQLKESASDPRVWCFFNRRGEQAREGKAKCPGRRLRNS